MRHAPDCSWATPPLFCHSRSAACSRATPPAPGRRPPSLQSTWSDPRLAVQPQVTPPWPCPTGQRLSDARGPRSRHHNQPPQEPQVKLVPPSGSDKRQDPQTWSATPRAAQAPRLGRLMPQLRRPLRPRRQPRQLTSTSFTSAHQARTTRSPASCTSLAAGVPAMRSTFAKRTESRSSACRDRACPPGWKRIRPCFELRSWQSGSFARWRLLRLLRPPPQRLLRWLRRPPQRLLRWLRPPPQHLLRWLRPPRRLRL